MTSLPKSQSCNYRNSHFFEHMESKGNWHLFKCRGCRLTFKKKFGYGSDIPKRKARSFTS